MNSILYNLCGYLFGIIGGYIFIGWIIEILWNCIGWNMGKSRIDIRISWLSPIVGWIERALYIASFQVRKPEFIGVWLTLKVLVQWNRWNEDKYIDGKIVSGRAIYNIFLIGNGLSVTYALVGATLNFIKRGDKIKNIVTYFSLLDGVVVPIFGSNQKGKINNTTLKDLDFFIRYKALHWRSAKKY